MTNRHTHHNVTRHMPSRRQTSDVRTAHSANGSPRNSQGTGHLRPVANYITIVYTIYYFWFTKTPCKSLNYAYVVCLDIRSPLPPSLCLLAEVGVVAHDSMESVPSSPDPFRAQALNGATATEELSHHAPQYLLLSPTPGAHHVGVVSRLGRHLPRNHWAWAPG